MPGPQRLFRRTPTLLHPVPLGAIVLLVVNDHVLKARGPGFVTPRAVSLVRDPTDLLALPFAFVSLGLSPRAPRSPQGG
jgi:hypothetical protein